MGHHEHHHEEYLNDHHHEEHHHDHHHEEHHHHGSQKRQIIVIGSAALLLAAAMLTEHYCELPVWQLLLVYLVPYLLVGHETLCEAAEGIAHGDMWDEHFLMSVATVGALAIGFMPGGSPEFAEAVFVMLFFQVGELFESYAEGQSRRSISALMDIRPDVATVRRDGQLSTIPAADVAVGETIVVRPGERIPLDGTVAEGSSSVDTSALTGESVPQAVAVGDAVASGCVNLSGVVSIVVGKTFGDSTASRIISLVEDAAGRKSRSETFITRFARVYTPVVVVGALLLAVVPPLFAASYATAFTTWLHRALIFLVVSCPCALVISVPLTFFGGLGGASRKGVLVKGANFLDMLSSVQTVVFDKTGTLTRGRFTVTAVHPDRFDADRLLHVAAHVERFSTHPIGAALRDAFPAESTDGCSVENVNETSGHGVRATVDGLPVCVGNRKMMESLGVDVHDCADDAGTVVHVAVGCPEASASRSAAGEQPLVYAGHILISDSVKPDSRAAIDGLRSLGVSRVVMLTGDRREVADAVAAELGIDEHHSGLLPADKVAHVERLLSGRTGDGRLVFVGDGINDAPVLARADIGVAMGGIGSDAAIEAADVVIMDDSPSRIVTAIAVARRTISIARQNVALAIGVKAAVLLLAAVGLATMWMAVFADVGVTVLAVLNAMRSMRA